jgi:hypothetical protein
VARPRRQPRTPHRLILDSGAVVALARNEARARAVLVLTGDPDDLGVLAAGHPDVVVRPL